MFCLIPFFLIPFFLIPFSPRQEPSLSSFRMKKTGDTLLSAQPKAASSTETCNSACEIFQKNVAYLLMTIQDPEIMAEELSAGNAVTSAVVEFANNMTHERGH